MRIDSHQHFWKFDPVRDSWINDEMSLIQKDFLPADLQSILHKHRLDGCITVQSDQSLEENRFQLQLGKAHSFIKGIVGWVDLRSDELEAQLEPLKGEPLMKGFRHVLQGEARRDLMLDTGFMRGIKTIGKAGYTYDVLIFADQLKYLPAFLQAFPDQVFVLDHIAKPPIAAGSMKEWAEGIKSLKPFPNLYCKISGMVTEASWNNWQYEHFEPYIDIVTEAFGIDRLMFGSDWPVCNVAGGYDRMISIPQQYFYKFSKDEQAKFWGGNATRAYRL